MSEWRLPWSASCICGQVQMRVTKPPLVSMACHCTGCQKLTSGPYSISFLVPSDGFEVTRGEPVTGGLHREHKQYYCPHCKGWVFTRPAGMDFVNFRPTLLEDASWVRPFVDIAAAEKLPGVESGAEMSFDGFPGPEDFPPIMAAFSERGARPA
ncbi:MAG: GFA family protein [Pseudomonadota bacterium]